jgi:hypothetical protein
MLGVVRRIRGVFAMIKIVQGVLFGSTLFLASAPAQATVTLASLIADGGTITDGDKVFSDFSYTPSGATPRPPPTSPSSRSQTARANMASSSATRSRLPGPISATPPCLMSLP